MICIAALAQCLFIMGFLVSPNLFVAMSLVSETGYHGDLIVKIVLFSLWLTPGACIIPHCDVTGGICCTSDFNSATCIDCVQDTAGFFSGAYNYYNSLVTDIHYFVCILSYLCFFYMDHGV